MKTYHHYYGTHCCIKDLKSGNVLMNLTDSFGDSFFEKEFKNRKTAIIFFRKKWGYEPVCTVECEEFKERLQNELKRFS